MLLPGWRLEAIDLETCVGPRPAGRIRPKLTVSTLALRMSLHADTAVTRADRCSLDSQVIRA